MTIVYQTTLPDPNNLINDSGGVTGGSAGAGYKSVQLTSKTQTMKNRTNSGRFVTRSNGFHQWDVQIQYNPMTREEFEPIYNFLLFRQGGLKPFYVSLPQYAAPRDASFSTFVSSNTVYAFEDTNAGSSKMWISAADMTGDISGDPKPGDIFNIKDSNDVNHEKVYMINRVEDSTDYAATGPRDRDRVIHFTPPLAKSVKINSEIIFKDPKIKVILSKDIQEYNLNVEGLYQFGLELEEVQ